MAELLTSELGISRLNTMLNYICDSLPIESGAIQMLASQYYERYGIGITDDNRERLKAESFDCYRVWEIGTSESNRAITRAINAIGLGQGDRELNKGVAELLVELMLGIDDGQRHFHVADLGAGPGGTTDTVLEFLRKDEMGLSLASRCTFDLVELSWDRLAEARTTIGRNKINESIRTLRCNPKCEPLEEYLAGKRNLDVIFSSGALHHCSFSDHFVRMYEALNEDGVLVVGDWHNSLFSHPANLISVLGRLGASTSAISDFKLLFGVNEDDAKRFEKELTIEERIANLYFADFIVKMASELRKIEERSRLPFFEALESVGDRTKKIKDAKFIMDVEELRREKPKSFGKLTDPEKGDLIRPIFPKTTVACVMGAGKIVR